MEFPGDFERETADAPFERGLPWKGGALAGCVATVVMGLALTAVDASIVSESIAGLYGASGNLRVGWVAHLVHGTLFGVVFAVVLSAPGLYRVGEWLPKSVLAGVVYGLVLAVAGAGIVTPMWLEAVGVAGPSSLPHVTVTLLVWHAVYGGVLGALFPVFEGWVAGQ
jgi:hypothetical protein